MLGKKKAPKFVEHNGLILPPQNLRLGSMSRKSDEIYVRYSKNSVKWLERHADVTKDDRILDIGCGPARLLTGMLARWGDVAGYVGIDVSRTSIDWASEHLQSPPKIQFHHVDVESKRYNPDGTSPGTKVALPVADDAVDTVVLLSVFSHMFLDEIGSYFAEIARVLARDGAVVLTAFVEQDVPPEVENPEDYLAEWKGALHCVRLNREKFEAMAHANGLTVARFEYRSMASGQSLYVFRHRDSYAGSLS